MDGTDLNGLAEINPGFNLTTGNLDLGTQLVERIRVHCGDAHGRRTDNGSAIYNPFVGNYGLEAFNTSKSATSGRIDPGFRDEVISLMLNPFVTIVGLELFGTYERSQEPGPWETAERVVPDREHLAEGRVRRPGL